MQDAIDCINIHQQAATNLGRSLHPACFWRFEFEGRQFESVLQYKVFLLTERIVDLDRIDNAKKRQLLFAPLSAKNQKKLEEVLIKRALSLSPVFFDSELPFKGYHRLGTMVKSSVPNDILESYSKIRSKGMAWWEFSNF